MPTHRRRTAAALAVAGAGIAYSSWVLEFVLPTGLDPMRSFLSELDAVGRPYAEVFSTGDTITAGLSIVAAVLGLWIARPGERWVRASWVALLVFAGATLADVLAPIECIPGVDPQCPTGPSGLFPQLHHVHALTSSVAVFAIFAAMIGFTVAAYRYGRWPLLRRVGLTVLVITSAATVWMLVADNLPGDYALGLAQRIQIGGITVWMTVLGAALWRESGRQFGAQGARPGRAVHRNDQSSLNRSGAIVSKTSPGPGLSGADAPPR